MIGYYYRGIGGASVLLAVLLTLVIMFQLQLVMYNTVHEIIIIKTL